MSYTAPTGVVFELDSKNVPFSPSGCSHTYTYDGSGNVLTDTAVQVGLDGLTVTRVKTYTYSGSNVLTASLWVVQ